MPKTQVISLDQEDSLEKEMATHSSVLARKILPGQRSLAGHSAWGHKESEVSEWLTSHTHVEFVTPLLLFYILVFWL